MDGGEGAIWLDREIDGITGLPRRRAFLESLDGLIREHPDETLQRLWLGTLQLPVLQYLRSALGWDVADRCLLELIRVLRQQVPHALLIGRLDGPELAVAAIVPEDGILREEYQSRSFLGRVFHVDDRAMFLNLRVGLAWWNPGDDAADLLRKASVALNRAGTGLWGDLVVWDREMEQESAEAAAIAVDLPAAMENNELELVYQPKVRLRDGRLAGVEALLRWPLWTGRGLEISKVIRIAELTDFIIPLGRWVLRRACMQAARWKGMGLEPFRIAVNISAIQLVKSEIQTDILDALRAENIGPEWLEIELTENALMAHGHHAPEILEKIHELGIPVAIDDFGTGYSSLEYMKRFPIQRLKIDRCFIDGLKKDPMDEAIVRCVIAIGKNMGFQVVAEGVETEEQLEVLRSTDCHEAQGYLFSPPLAPEDIPGFLSRTRSGS